MSEISFKSAAEIHKATYKFRKHSHISAAVCVMAHAISRGRNPTSPVPGINPRVWWRDNLMNHKCGKEDLWGEPCNLLTYLEEWTNDCDFPREVALRKAINVCRNHFDRVGWPKVPLTAEEKQQRQFRHTCKIYAESRESFDSFVGGLG